MTTTRSLPGRLRRAAWTAAVAASAVLAGCTTVASVPVAAGAPPSTPAAPAPTATPAPAPSATATCTAADKADQNAVVRSYAPAGDVRAVVGSDRFLGTVTKRRRLIVGVSADTRLFGARNPESNQIEGFDIELLKAVSQAIFGRVSIEYRVITAAQRIPFLVAGTVDIVARTMTVTCERWKQIAFSSVYFQAGQKILVRRVAPGAPGQVSSVDALPAGSKVCAPKGSTSIERMRSSYPLLVPVEVSAHTDCLVLFQQGTIDAITGDDAILAGFAAQDPYAVVPAEQKAFSSEPYGLGIAKQNRAFVSVVNAVLDQVRTSGQWQRFYADNGLAAALGPAQPPTPLYGRS